MSASAELRPTRRLDDAALLARRLRIDDDGDKSSRGTTLVVGGSRWTGGAVLLSGLAALRMGAGRLQLATAESLTDALTLAVPEAMVVPVSTGADGSLQAPPPGDRVLELAARADSVLVGPGLVDGAGADALVRAVLGAVGDQTVVTLDAAALRRLAELDGPLPSALRGRLVLTPNDDELDALLGASRDQAPRLDRCRRAADRFGAVVTSFGVVAEPGGPVWISDARCPGLGTSGSGDVLAGLVAGAAARDGDAGRAACWATQVHLEAGVRLARRCGAVGFLGRELLEETATVMAALEPPDSPRPGA